MNNTNTPKTRLRVESTIDKFLPAMVRTELGGFSASDQEAFVEEFNRKSKGLFGTYVCSIIYCHYAFLGRWGMTVLMWLVALVTIGIGGVIWWVIDLFRIPGLVRDYNRDLAITVMRNFKAVTGR